MAQDAAAYGADFASPALGKHGADYSNDNYHNCDKSQLNELLMALRGIKGDFWVRLLYLHPDHFPLDILDTIKSDQRFLPYPEIPTVY
ncbi:hypothetical protein FACS1894102_7650 [Spirochaetia bacterium]|nr:hypothetical protein FACS1894102_7650 [Spirochaetia bacterium]